MAGALRIMEDGRTAKKIYVTLLKGRDQEVALRINGSNEEQDLNNLKVSVSHAQDGWPLNEEEYENCSFLTMDLESSGRKFFFLNAPLFSRFK